MIITREGARWLAPLNSVIVRDEALDVVAALRAAPDLRRLVEATRTCGIKIGGSR